MCGDLSNRNLIGSSLVYRLVDKAEGVLSRLVLRVLDSADSYLIIREYN